MNGTVIIYNNGRWLRFTRPLEIVSVNRADMVLPALLNVEHLVEQEGLFAAGFLSYEASPAFDKALKVNKKNDLPILWFGLYNQPEDIASLPGQDSGRDYGTGSWEPEITGDDYNSALQKIRGHIIYGDTYQVNYTFRMRNSFSGNAFNLFYDLVKTGPAPYSAFIDAGNFAVCSASPELFFTLDGNMITCRPMKGTVKRGLTTAEDAVNRNWLQSSEKNRAENIMITDMIRNDLGRIADRGSVSVPSLFDTERYPDLWQMTSTIEAQTACGLTDIMKALFPCASITGAPKVRTMEIISQLEQSPRGIYTGCIGYVAPGRMARFSVAIRTVTIDRNKEIAEYGTGGGIVLDSTVEDEYSEAMLKASAVTRIQPEFRLFETILFIAESGFSLLERHLDRIENSAGYFGFTFRKELIVSALQNRACECTKGSLRMKLLLARDGSLEVQSTTISPAVGGETPYRTRLAADTVSSENVFLYHKTTERKIYDNALKSCPGFDDVLLHNERGEITEFTIGNFAALLNGVMVTPPASCGLLAGTFRAEMIESGRLTEQVVRINQLALCDEVFMLNSVRGWQRVQVC